MSHWEATHILDDKMEQSNLVRAKNIRAASDKQTQPNSRPPSKKIFAGHKEFAEWQCGATAAGFKITGGEESR